MNWESHSNKNLFGWEPASSRPRSLTILRSWPELKLGNLAPNSGAPKRDLSTKVQRAADYYRGKYGREPTECQVHKSEGAVPESVGRISIRTSVSVLAGHFWLGMEEA